MIYDSSYSIGFRGHGHEIYVRKEGWTEGVVATNHGFVDVYAQGCDKHSHVTRLSIIISGTCFTRTFNGKRYKPRGIVTKAIEFAEEMKSVTDRKGKQ